MSSPASVVLRLELRPWPVADRVAAALVVAAALAIVAVAGQTPEPRPDLGVLALGLLGGWLWYRRRAARGIVALAVAGDGRFWTEYRDGRRIDSEVLPGSRRPWQKRLPLLVKEKIRTYNSLSPPIRMINKMF